MSRCCAGIVILSGVFVAAAQVKPPADEVNDQGLAASWRGDYAEAERLLSQSLRMWQEMGPQYEAHAAIVMMNLAEAECGEGRWSEGAALLAKALEISRRALGSEELHTVTNMNLLGSAKLVLGELDQAIAYFNEALAIERRKYPKDTQLAHSLMGISSYHVRINEMKEALPPAEEGLKILTANGENNLDTAMAFANVAQIHLFSQRPERALPLFRKAKAIYERLNLTTSPRYASVLSQEGLAQLEDNKPASADRTISQALDILSHCTGCQYLTAIAESNLGLVRFREGKYTDADSLLTRALALEESYTTGPGTEMAATLNRLADVRRKEHRDADAENLHHRALTMQTYR